MVSRTRTTPRASEAVESMVYAVFSCSHMANGYFHAYDVASTIKYLDFWVHTGDYVYEYGLFKTYASDSPEGKARILPEWEQISLQDHRIIPTMKDCYTCDLVLHSLVRRTITKVPTIRMKTERSKILGPKTINQFAPPTLRSATPKKMPPNVMREKRPFDSIMPPTSLDFSTFDHQEQFIARAYDAAVNVQYLIHRSNKSRPA